MSQNKPLQHKRSPYLWLRLFFSFAQMKGGLSVTLRTGEAASSWSYIPQHPWAQRLFQRIPEPLETLGSKPESLWGCGFAKPRLGVAHYSGNSLQAFLGTQVSCANVSTTNGRCAL